MPKITFPMNCTTKLCCFYILLFLSLIPIHLNGQCMPDTFRYLIPEMNEVNNMKKTPDGGYIGLGYKSGPYNGVIFKLDAAKKLLWSKRFDFSLLFLQTDLEIDPNDGSIYLAGVLGRSLGGLELNGEGVVFKLNRNGEPLWGLKTSNRPFGVTEQILFTTDGNLLFTTTGNSSDSQRDDTQIFKISSEGEILESTVLEGIIVYDLVNSMDNDGFYIAGKPNEGLGMVIKLNAQIQVINIRSYAVADFPDNVGFGQQTITLNNRGGVLLGMKGKVPNGGDFESIMISTDQDLNVIWAKRWSFAPDPALARNLAGIVPIENSDFIAVTEERANRKIFLTRFNEGGLVKWTNQYEIEFFNYDSKPEAFDGEIFFSGDRASQGFFFLPGFDGFMGECGLSSAEEVFDPIAIQEDFSSVNVLNDNLDISPFGVFVRDFPVSLEPICIFEPPLPPEFSLGPDTTLCSETSINLFPGKPYFAYEWSTGDTVDLIEVTEPGLYKLRAFDRCDRFVEDSIFVNVFPKTTIELPDQVSCRGDTLQVGLDNLNTYKWIGRDIVGCDTCSQLNVLTNRDLRVEFEGIDVQNCTVRDTFEVEVVNTSRTRDFITICTGEQATIFGEEVSIPDLYTRTFSNVAGCDSIAEVILEVVERPRIAIEVQTACIGENAGSVTINSLDPSQNLQYFWPQFNTDTPNLTDLEPGNYTLQIENEQGCLIDTMIQVNVDSFSFNTSFSLIDFVELNLGDSIELRPNIPAGNSGLSFEWFPKEFVSCDTCFSTFAKPFTSEDILLVITSEKGCEITLSTRIEVFDETPVYIPNSFSPNGDGINDFFTIFAGPFVSNINVLRIFDRWGNLVFERENYSPGDTQRGWNGRFQGMEANDGTYIYMLDLQMLDDTRRVFKGSITLIR